MAALASPFAYENGQLGPVANIEDAEQLRELFFYSVPCDFKVGGNLPIGPAPAQVLEHLQLPAGQE